MAIWLKFKGYIIAIVGGVLAALGIYFAGRREGYNQAELDAREADYESARRIEDKADRVRRADGDNLPPVERLQRHKRLRDI